jgi:hypothetical protein
MPTPCLRYLLQRILQLPARRAIPHLGDLCVHQGNPLDGPKKSPARRLGDVFLQVNLLYNVGKTLAGVVVMGRVG